MKTTNWKECLQQNLPTNIFASLVVRKISRPNHISSFYGKFVYKRKALHLFRSINGFLQCTLRLEQSNFHLASVFPQNLMYRGSRKNSFDLNNLCFHSLLMLSINSDLTLPYARHTACCNLFSNNNTALYVTVIYLSRSFFS